MIAENGLVLQKKLAKKRMAAGGGDKVSDKAREGAGKETVPAPVSQGQARDIVGKAAGISGKMVEKAAQVKRDGIPELAEAVRSNTISVSQAAEVAKLPKAKQQQVVKSDKPKREAKRVIAESQGKKPPFGALLLQGHQTTPRTI